MNIRQLLHNIGFSFRHQWERRSEGNICSVELLFDIVRYLIKYGFFNVPGIRPLGHLILSYLLTPCSTVLLEKLTGSQLVKKIPHILCNPKIHHRIHKFPPTIPILNQLDPLHTPTSHFLKIHLNLLEPEFYI